MSNLSQMVDTIQSLRPTQVVRNELVRQQFINVYNAVWREGGEQVYEREANHFNKILRDSDKLRACTAISVFFSFIDLAVQGLSVEPGPRAMAYLLPRGYKVTSGGKELWEQRCNLTISGQGELFLRARAGQIHHADNPVVVYEGDEFDFGEQNGQKFVNYRSRIPHTSNHIIACFMKITRTDGTFDYAVMTEQDWKRLYEYSAKNNTFYDKNTHQKVSKPNELYSSANGSIDPGFLCAKCIKHAFKTYPKLNIGKGSVLETQVADEPPTDFDPYAGVTQAESAPEEQTFAQPRDMSQGVTIDPAAPAPAPAAEQAAPTATPSAPATGTVTAPANDDVF